MSNVAYWVPPDENPNFVSRPPDPGAMGFFKTIGWEALYHSPFLAVQRFSEMTLEKSDYFNVAGRVLDPAEANQQYGLGGQLVFDEPIKEEAAQLMYRRKIDENDRAYLIGSGQTSGFRKVASYPVAMAATLVDPINFASMFIPVVGEARIARLAQSVGGSALRQRLVQGALTGVGGAAMVEPFILLPALQDQSNYNLRDSAMNLGFGAALGGLLHAGLGAIGDRMRRMRPKDADAIFEAAMNNILKDEPVTAPARIAEFVDETPPAPVKTDADYFYHLDHTNAPLESFKEKGILPSKDGYQGPGVYLAEKPEMTEVYGTLADNTLYRVDKQKLLAHFGKFSDENPGGVQLGEPAEVLIAGKKSIPPEFVEVRQGDQWVPLVDSQLAESTAPSLNDIPTRDARGRFLSKDQRLQMLDQKIREEQAAKSQNRGQIVNDNTKENTPGFPNDNLGMTGESAKDINSITSETAEIEKSLEIKTQTESTTFASVEFSKPVSAPYDPEAMRYTATIDGKKIGFYTIRQERGGLVIDEALIDKSARGNKATQQFIKHLTGEYDASTPIKAMSTPEARPFWEKLGIDLRGKAETFHSTLESVSAKLGVEKPKAAELNLTPIEREILDEAAQDFSKTRQREAGVSEAVKCIIRNLI